MPPEIKDRNGNPVQLVNEEGVPIPNTDDLIEETIEVPGAGQIKVFESVWNSKFGPKHMLNLQFLSNGRPQPPMSMGVGKWKMITKAIAPITSFVTKYSHTLEKK